MPGEAHGHGALGEKPTGCSLRGTEDGPGDARWGQAVGAARVPEGTEGSSSCETCKETEAINLLKACSALSVTPLGWDLLGWDLPTRRSYPPPPEPAATRCPQGEALPPGAVPVALPVALPQPPGSVRALNTEPARSPPSPHRLLLTGPRLASPQPAPVPLPALPVGRGGDGRRLRRQRRGGGSRARPGT